MLTAIEKKDGYGYAFGYSVALAQVAAAIAVAKSSTDLSNSQIRNLILSSGTSALVGDNPKNVSISNKRLQLVGANNNGMFNCQDQIVQKRIFPASENWLYRVLGDELIVKGLSINCAQPHTPLQIKNSVTGATFTALDDGLGLDEKANDGYNITTVKFTQTGLQKLQITGDKSLPVYVLNPYKTPEVVDLIWKESSSNIGEHQFHAPFLFKFGGLPQGITNCFYSRNHSGQYVISFPQSTDAFGDPAEQSDKCQWENVYPRKVEQLDNKLTPNAVIKKIQSGFINPTNPIKTVKGIDAIDTTADSYYSSLDDDYVANDITKAGTDVLSLIMYGTDDKFSYYRWQSRRMFSFGGPGNRVVVFEVKPSLDQDQDQDAIQVMLFEKNSTLVLSYKNISTELIEGITKRGIKLGKYYEMVSNDPVISNTSLVFKVNDGTANVKPLLKNATINMLLNEGETFDLNRLFADQNNDVLFFKAQIAQSNISVDALGELRLHNVANLSESTLVTFELTVSDGEATTTATMNIDFGSTNYAPTQIQQFGAINKKAEDTVQLALPLYFEDFDGDALSYSTNSAIAAVQVIDDIPTLVINGGQPGNHSIALAVSDGISNLTVTISVVIAGDNSQQPSTSQPSGGGSLHLLFFILMLLALSAKTRNKRVVHYFRIFNANN
ncbi:MAG: hypothetical protein HRT35_35935 [Algicola sp.]|nr:hypothetical protein [Algicola sp.]